jgi:hypothetical protein
MVVLKKLLLLNMSTIRTNTFKIRSNENRDVFNVVTVTVKHYENDNGEWYYDIGYDYEFHHPTDMNEEMVSWYKTNTHPFYNYVASTDSISMVDVEKGEILVANGVSKAMAECLLMSNEELRPECGYSTLSHYRTQVMVCISQLWD